MKEKSKLCFALCLLSVLATANSRVNFANPARSAGERGYTLEEFPAAEADPIPRPMFYSPESKSYEVEAWFQPEMLHSALLCCDHHPDLQ